MITWIINQIDHTVNPDGTSGDATSIHWTAGKTVDALKAEYYGSEAIDPPVPYASLTEAEAVAYLEATLDMVALEAHLDSLLAAQGAPQTAGGLPWQHDYPQWVVGMDYSVEYVVVYSNIGYECIQAHSSQTTWPPDLTPAMWKLYVPDSEGPQPWVQPAGSHDAYDTGDRVTHLDDTWESSIDANVWEPGVTGWFII